MEPPLLQHGRGVAEPQGTVVVVNLVGGLDGLSVLVPHGDRAYADRRPGLAVAPPGERYGAIDLGRGVGLHPALAPLQQGFGRSDRLAVIAGVGVPDGHEADRRHLPSREFVHRGGRHQREGWATRLLRFEGMGSEVTWSFGAGPHPMFEGLAPSEVEEAPAPAVTVAANAAGRGATPVGPDHSNHNHDDRGEGGPAAATRRWSEVDWRSPADRLARGYPEGRLGRSLAATVELLRDPARPRGAGVRLVAIEQAGYDTHVDQGDGRSGVLAHKLDGLARSLAAFWAEVVEWREHDDDRRGDPVTVVVVSEFGRAIAENDSGGTEHGRAGVALAMGDRVVGGVHGDLPRLSTDEVWPVTVDVRRVLADAVASHGFRPWRGGIFPRLSLPNRSLGLLLSP